MYGNEFLDDFSGYGGLPAATSYAQPMAQPAAAPQPAVYGALPSAASYTQPMGGLPPMALMEDTVLPDVADMQMYVEPPTQAMRQQRLQEPIQIKSWMTSGTKDVRGTKPAESITLQPGKQYQLVNFTGDASGEIIAAGSTPEEFLRIQDLAEGLNSQGRRADWRLQEVGDEPPAGGFGSALDPTTGKYITTLGGDLYNKSGWSTVGDIAKIAVPIALQFIPGLGTALGAQLGLSGLGAKAVGIGLTSALGRTGAGLATGENIGDALKAGAIGGLASGATAGLLGATGVDKALGSALGGAKGALAGEAARQAAASVPGEILVSASRLAPAVLGGLGAAGGSLLGDVGKSIAQPDQFQQALDQARLNNRFDPNVVGAVEEPGIVVSAARDTFSPGLSALSAAPAAVFNISDYAGMVGDGTTAMDTVEEPELNPRAPRTPPAGIDSALPAVVGPLTQAVAPPAQVTEPRVMDTVEEPELNPRAPRTPPPIVSVPLVVPPIPSVPPITPPPQVTEPPVISDGTLVVPPIPPIPPIPPPPQVTQPAEGGGLLSRIDPVRLGVTGLVGLVSALTRGGGGGGGGSSGNAAAGTRASLDPIFSAKLPAPSAQYSSASFAPRDMSGVDFARYGYGPAQSFFENVPRNPEEYRSALAANAPTPRPSGALNLPPVTMPQTVGADPTASLTSLIRTYIPSATDAEITEFFASDEGKQFLTRFGGAPVPRARGGSMRGTGTSRESYAVNGAGTGRSDEIPALLSDGEYVIDAETVAMLGDGSGKAGAKRLDDLRVNIRKHKGRNLAKGKFSANAKRPERYLTGGRAQ